jgi:probable phosphoglycerate mutase
VTTVVLLRHGETDWNRNDRVQGWAAVPLNERGREQARTTGRQLSSDYDFDRVVASDLRRTKETTALVRDCGDYPEPTFDSGWRERDFGVFQGFTDPDLFGTFPEYDTATGRDSVETTPPDGESFLDARERVFDAWDRLLDDADGDETVLVITHGGPIYIMLGHVKEMALPDAIETHSQHNCGLVEFETNPDNGHVELVRENDIYHDYPREDV